MTRTWWVTIAYTVFILLLVGLANVGAFPMPCMAVRELPCADAVGHFLLMGGLAFFVNLALEARRIGIGPVRVQIGSLIVLGFVLIEESSQLWLIHRTFSWSDLFGNLVGIFCFGHLARAIVLARRERAAAASGLGDRAEQ